VAHPDLPAAWPIPGLKAVIRRKATTPGAVYPATAVAALHTWLPDAHSEAPTPVSALPSGSLLAASFYAILRFDQFTAAALGSSFPRDALLAFGVASLLLASQGLSHQRHRRRHP